MKKNIDVYQNMSPREISLMFNKKLSTVNMGISRMIKEYPDFKIKNGRNIEITSSGVDWLANYFVLDRTPAPLNEDIFKLEMEVKVLKELLEAEKKHTNEFLTLMGQQYQERLEENKRTLLLENENKIKTIEVLEDQNNRL